MAFDYASIITAAEAQIANAGRSVTYLSNGVSYYNSTLDELQGDVVSEKEIVGVFTSYKTAAIDGTIIKNDDKLFLMVPQTGIEPKINDGIVDGETEYKVIAVTTIAPGNKPVLHKLQLRR